MNRAIVSVSAFILIYAFIVTPVGAGTAEGDIGELGAVFDASSAQPVDGGETGGSMELGVPSPGSGLSAATAHARLQGALDAAAEGARGGAEVELYQTLSPSVVMVVTDTGLGSGILIGDAGTVVTNWHVVENFETVGVIYKPADDFEEVGPSHVRRATVVRIDQVADLALLQIEEPQEGFEPLELGSVEEVPVGSDVHAIGHPTGESWTYTRGIVSQVRRDYEWVTESGVAHEADVIQTQTPINPGNSGGPLISDNHTLVGVNSFISDAEGINFAVSVDEVRNFLDSDENRYAAAYRPDSGSGHAECAMVQPLGEQRAPGRTITYVDLNCDGEADGYRTTPDDPSGPVTFSVDTTGDQRVDTIFSDMNRDGHVDRSVYDINGDGRPDLIGYHRNGEMEPYRFEEYRG